jgi:hypothetical protein
VPFGRFGWLFDNQNVADQVVHDLDARAYPRSEIRILKEPEAFSFSRQDQTKV